MRVVVTGAKGQLGTELLGALSDLGEVQGLDRPVGSVALLTQLYS
ncbi:MAG TPA: hypothetical protein VN648_09810 [Candidatus Methylomirabilis sp.]|nr:hypothetical protein [Candidatus Methylomirabilis sp.]